MRQSELFTKTRREAPKDEVAKNAQLLIRAGYIHKEMAGVYDLLPLGLRVIEKIKKIVREEMDAIGGQELLMSSLQRKELWEQTERWADEKVDVWFKSELKSGGEVGFGWSHEEPITDMMKQYIASYRDLPMFVYQFQTKLRNELRAKSGIMRGREFLMKDMYSFTTDEEAHNKFYESMIDAYLRIFKRAGLGDRTYKTFASGGAFTKYSHEFQTLCDSGEDIVYVDTSKEIAINKEVLSDEIKKDLGVGELVEAKAVEVGNIFDFAGVKSAELGLYYKNEAGQQIPVHLGSYGIGITRLMGTIVEVLADDKGIVWPESIAPFRVHLVEIKGDTDEVTKEAEELYRELTENGVEVLYDDTDRRAGEKFADSDLLGIPLRVIVSQKTLTEGKFECAHRQSGRVEHKSLSELISHLTHA